MALTVIGASEYHHPPADREAYGRGGWCEWCGRYWGYRGSGERCPSCNESHGERFRVMAHDSMFTPEMWCVEDVMEIQRVEMTPQYGWVSRYSPMRHVEVLKHIVGGPRMRVNSWGPDHDVVTGEREEWYVY